MKTFAFLFFSGMAVFLQASSSAASYPGKCQLIAEPKGTVTALQCNGIPEGAARYLNEFLQQLEQSRLRNPLSRSMRIKLGEDWSRKFLDLKNLLLRETSRSPIIARIQTSLNLGEFSKTGDLIDSVLVEKKSESSLQALLNFIRARIYDLQFQDATAAPFYEKAYQHEKSNARYGLFHGLKLLDQNQFGQARTVFEGALRQLKKIDSGKTIEQQYHRGSLLINLGLIYKKTQNIRKAERFYVEALEVFQALGTRSGNDYRFEIAVTLDNLGNLFQETRKFNEAKQVHTQALELFRALTKEQPEAYQQDLGIGLSNLGNLLGTLQQYEEARELIEESLEIFRELAQTEASSYLFKLAVMLDNTGVLYKRMGNLAEAEKIHKEALGIYSQTLKINNSAYLADYAITLTNLGAVYELQKNYGEMEKVLEEASEIFRELSKKNTMAYLPSWGIVLLTQGDYFAEIKKDTGRARQLYKEALSRFTLLSRFNPDNYSRYVQIVLNKLKALGPETPPSP